MSSEVKRLITLSTLLLKCNRSINLISKRMNKVRLRSEGNTSHVVKGKKVTQY